LILDEFRLMFLMLLGLTLKKTGENDFNSLMN
jgi:hypothetical protein